MPRFPFDKFTDANQKLGTQMKATGEVMQAFCTKAAENKVAVVPGTAFVIGDEKCNSFRINYSAPTDEKLTEAVQILGRVAKEF